MKLTRKEYIQTILSINYNFMGLSTFNLMICHIIDDVEVPPRWSAQHLRCSEHMVDRWWCHSN